MSSFLGRYGSGGGGGVEDSEPNSRTPLSADIESQRRPFVPKKSGDNNGEINGNIADNSGSSFSSSVRNFGSSMQSRFNEMIMPGSNEIGTGSESTVSENNSWYPQLSYQTRLTGFVSCYVAGFMLSFFSSFTLLTGNLVRFAFIYTVGNLVAIFGTTFLIGVERQMKGMFDETRKISTIVYITSLLLTIFFALSSNNFGRLLVIPMIVVQWCAGIWYGASYIPYGRQAIKGFVNSVTGLQL